MSMAFINTSKVLDVVVDGVNYTINKSSEPYIDILYALATKDKESVLDAINNVVDMRSVLKSNVTPDSLKITDDDIVTWNGKQIHGTMITRLIKNRNDKENFDGIFKFIEKVMETKNTMICEELYDFLEIGNLPINENGNFYAYKVVTEGYLDCHTQTIDNSVGVTVEIDRKQVDPERNNHCSYGLHFCSFDYLKHFSCGNTRIVKVEVDPRDVVTIPPDYNNTKARCCRYKVVEEVTDKVSTHDKDTDIFSKSPQVSDVEIQKQIEKLRKAYDALLICDMDTSAVTYKINELNSKLDSLYSDYEDYGIDGYDDYEDDDYEDDEYDELY